MLKELCCYSLFLALILKFLTIYDNINSILIYHSDKMILSFSMKIYLFRPNSDLDSMTDGCLFRFAFKYGFNLPAKVLAYSKEK